MTGRAVLLAVSLCVIPLPGGCKKRDPLLPGMVGTKERTEGGEGGDLMSKLGRRRTRAEAARDQSEPVRLAAAKADPDNAVYALTLAEALPGDKPLTIHLDRAGGAFRDGIGTAPAFNKAPHDVDASGLKLEGNRLTGEVKVTVNPDNWVPKGLRRVSCAYAIRAVVEGPGLAGTYHGTCGAEKVGGGVSGRLAARSPLPEPARFQLLLERGLSKTSRHWGNRAYVDFTVTGGRAAAPKIACPNNTTYADFTCQVDRIDGKFTARRLSCTIRATITGKGFCPTGGYTFALDGRVIGGAVAGTFATRRGGSEVAAGPFVGTVDAAAVPDPRDCLYELHMHRAAKDGKAVWVHLDCTAGAAVSGLAFAPQFNHAVHDVDASGLRLTAGRLAGTLQVTINPDPYVPADGKPIACTYRLAAEVKDGGIAGRLEGTFGPEEVEGVLAGLLVARPQPADSHAIWLKMEQGVTGSNPWSNRTYLHVTLKGGKAVDGRFSNNKGAWKGTFDRADLKLGGGRLAGTITATVTSGRVRKGTYTFALDGRVIGRHITGSFTSSLGGEVVRKGRFVGGIAPAG